MKVHKNRYKGFEQEHIVIKKTIYEEVNFKTLPLLEWEDLEQQLFHHLIKAKKKICNETEYRKSIKKIAKNRLVSIIREFTAQCRNSNNDVSLSDKDQPEIFNLKDNFNPPPDEIFYTQESPESKVKILWKLVEDKPAIYSDIIGMMLKTGDTNISSIARQLNIPRRTMRDKWNNIKKWSKNAGLNKII